MLYQMDDLEFYKRLTSSLSEISSPITSQIMNEIVHIIPYEKERYGEVSFSCFGNCCGNLPEEMVYIMKVLPVACKNIEGIKSLVEEHREATEKFWKTFACSEKNVVDEAIAIASFPFVNGKHLFVSCMKANGVSLQNMDEKPHKSE